MIPALFAAFLDSVGDYPARTDAFDLYSGKDIYIDANPPLQVQYDGELAKRTTPFRARVLPAAARYVVSKECRRLFAKEEEGKSAELDLEKTNEASSTQNISEANRHSDTTDKA